MSLETLLEAARYVELQEKKRERVASTSSSSSDRSFALAPHSNYQNSVEPCGFKIKKERSDQDDLFCEEKMLIIDEEEPLEKSKTNGNHSSGLRESPVVSSSRTTPPVASIIANPIAGHVTAFHSVALQQQQQQQLPHQIQHQQPLQPQQHHHNNHNSTQSHYLENHNSNHSHASGPLVVDLESSHDNKRHRNGPCVIRSGTREVHNKLEKNRRAHLKECFELLKRQLPSQDEKKSSNLSILHAAIKHIQAQRKKERDYEHEMERLAREKIAAQQRLAALKKELAATWDHIDFNTLLPEQSCTMDATARQTFSESMDVDVTGLARGGTRYSSTSSLSSAATANSPQNLQTTHTTHAAHTTHATPPSIHSQAATAAVVCQTQGLNLAQGSRESPPASSSPRASTPSIPTPAQEKVNTSPTIVQQSHLHLPISAQMLNTSQGLATIVPTLQHLGSGLRVIPGDTRQLLVTHTTAGSNESRPLTLAVQSSTDQSRTPLIAVQSNTGSEPRPVALVVHSSAANDNRVTFVHSNLSNNDRPLALAVQSTASDVRPLTFVHSGNEARPLVLATHSPALSVSAAQTRIRTSESQTTHKMVGGVTLVGGNGSELTRLPGGAELNILPANGLTLSHAGVSLQTTAGKSGSTIMQSTPSTEGIAHMVSQHTPLSTLTPLVTPMTVVSQGSQVTAHILAPSSLAGKMITTPILKSVGQMPLVNAQYLNTTTLVKPVVVVSSPSNASVVSSTPASSNQSPSSSAHSSV
ncbi:mucin-3B isoform X2 [Cephus cinctus]|uniref:Max-binding protein MNT n=1 Tax=Cephus cinctus TaxID=211228 RepID=A0AAJ7BY29_CEPCN|nr:mucin-3B isoform X2 [Cephus cinctus]XP_015597099.1 mucin-3B isoform X2 [Cephus cinctus]XP_015597100.1 mucin-3B isoform X2 [Cephus cinctus]XP_015597101.1 mucin-3B isoform X2 [Cephus cinctus]